MVSLKNDTGNRGDAKNSSVSTARAGGSDSRTPSRMSWGSGVSSGLWASRIAIANLNVC
eukprot:IDg1452t1